MRPGLLGPSLREWECDQYESITGGVKLLSTYSFFLAEGAVGYCRVVRVALNPEQNNETFCGVSLLVQNIWTQEEVQQQGSSHYIKALPVGTKPNEMFMGRTIRALRFTEIKQQVTCTYGPTPPAEAEAFWVKRCVHMQTKKLTKRTPARLEDLQSDATVKTAYGKDESEVHLTWNRLSNAGAGAGAGAAGEGEGTMDVL